MNTAPINTVRVVVAGAAGRMGRIVLECALRCPQTVVSAALVAPGEMGSGSIAVGTSPMAVSERLETPCDVLIDFTAPAGTMAWLEVCRLRSIPMVIGVTGHNAEQQTRIAAAAHDIPIVQAANFSTGISVLAEIAAETARRLGHGYDIEMIETHHRHKADAPSGTALALLNRLREATGPSGTHPVVYGRHGASSARTPGEIGVHAVRRGDVVGRHEIHFSGNGETITICHEAHSREAFAMGALRAAEWVVSKPPGLYGMNNVLAAI